MNVSAMTLIVYMVKVLLSAGRKSQILLFPWEVQALQSGRR